MYFQVRRISKNECVLRIELFCFVKFDAFFGVELQRKSNDVHGTVNRAQEQTQDVTSLIMKMNN